MRTTTTKSEVGVTIWFEHDGLTIHESESLHATARVMRRGEVLCVTEAIRRANTDTLSRCVFDLAASPDEQIQRFGKVMFRPGTPPIGFEPLTVDSPEFDAAREAAYRALSRIDNPDEQRIEAAKVRERFGVPSSARSKTLRTYNP